MEIVQTWIYHYGYLSLFALTAIGIAGPPVPNETLLIFSGYLIYKGDLHFIPALLCAYIGTITGISISYFAGRILGSKIIVKYGNYFHISEKRIQKVKNWFKRTGKWALFIGFFIPGIRHAIALIAGTSNLKYKDLAVFSYSGGFVWTCTFILIGFYFGEKIYLIHEIIIYLLISLSAVLIFSVLHYYYRKKHNKKNNNMDN